MTNFPTSNDFRNAANAQEFDALVAQAQEAWAAEFKTDEEFEAAGGDGAAIDAVESFLDSCGIKRPAVAY